MRLDWTAPALSDLRRISRFLELEARSDVAARTLTLIRERSTLLESFPLAGPALPDRGVRSLRVHRTPYIIVYRVNQQSVEILRVNHEREDWRES